ncbi:MAG: right-handed parallel beta-helix repeat-containing protein [Deltaproteobacteria bacterium]|nr:right-handed parallel beta-helix repeat-containing protein [Deltaproteobacteria bacterium]
MTKRRIARWRLVALCGALAVGSNVPATAQEVVVLPDGTPESLQAALEAARAATVPTAVVVPAGRWDWGEGRVLVDDLRDVVVLGVGAEQSRLVRETACPGGAMLQVERSSRVRVAELTFDGCDALTERNAEGNWTRPIGVQFVDVDDLRIDHCSIRDFGWAGVRSNGDRDGCRGVIDHCDFVRMYIAEMAPRYTLGYGVAVSGIGALEGVAFGSADATFIEDCTFDRTRHAVAAGGGARYVFRRNDVTTNRLSHAVDAHGEEGSAVVGTEWVEVYENVIHDPEAPTAAVRIRGGRGVVWGNTIRDYTYAVSLWEETPQPTGPVHIWGNHLGAGVARLGDVRGSPDDRDTAPAGYTAYAYPHRRITELEVRAGPDQNAIVGAAGTAAVYLDATASSADGGTIAHYRWYDGDVLVSTCARDVVELASGTHAVVLALERDDGLVDFDSAHVRALADEPLVSDGSWRNRWFVPLVGRGTIEVDATPRAAPMNGYVAFTGRRRVDGHEDHAILVRFNPDGRIDAYDGDVGYRADAVLEYRADVPVHLAIDVDVAARRYDVRVDGTTLAVGYAFRAGVLTVGQLTVWDASGELSVHGLQVRGELAEPDPACAGGADADADADADAETDVGTDADADVGTDADADVGTDAGADAPTVDAPPDTPAADATSEEPAATGCGCVAPRSGRKGAAGVLLALSACVLRRRRRTR